MINIYCACAVGVAANKMAGLRLVMTSESSDGVQQLHCFHTNLNRVCSRAGAPF